jgi:hypothetical protein
LREIIDLMVEKKVFHIEQGDVKVSLSPMAFQEEASFKMNDGNNAENIDELLYIKKPNNLGARL